MPCCCRAEEKGPPGAAFEIRRSGTSSSAVLRNYIRVTELSRSRTLTESPSKILHTLTNVRHFLPEKLRTCDDRRARRRHGRAGSVQQVRTKLPPDRHSERRFLLPPPLPSLPLTAAARRRRRRGRTHSTCAYSEAEGGRRGERMGSEILITLAYNPLFLSLSLYESKRVRNKIVERRHLSASFRALA